MLSSETRRQREYDLGYAKVERIVAAMGRENETPLFTTDAADLASVYLKSLPVAIRQHYNCTCCKRFLNVYGNLVTITDKGEKQSLLWEFEDVGGIEQTFYEVVRNLRKEVIRANVTGVFLSSDKTWGTPLSHVRATGDVWSHLHVERKNIYTPPSLLTVDQVMAEKREDYDILQRALTEFSLDVATEAVRVLESDALSSSGKGIEIARWFADLQKRYKTVHSSNRSNLLWFIVATAPVGFYHVCNTIVGTLLADLAAGYSFEDVKQRWEKKTHPLQYQRPTTMKEGTLNRAEEIVKQLGCVDSFPRRFATTADLNYYLWAPSATEVGSEVEADKGASIGLFTHLRKQKEKRDRLWDKVVLPPKTMTWEKFRYEILPTAAEIKFHVPVGRAAYFGLVTAVNPNAPPILQWDGVEGLPRNPVSWFHEHGGSIPSRWNLRPGEWVSVNAVLETPAMWQTPERFAERYGGKAMLLLEGARNVAYEQGGAFFPEFLRSEFREVRSVMEQWALSHVVAGIDEGDANGVALEKIGWGYDVCLRVTSLSGASSDYRLDRWE